MNNYVSALIIAAAIIVPCRSNARIINLQGAEYKVDTIRHYVAGPAMTYSRLAVRSDSNTFGVSVLEIDMDNPARPRIKVEPGCDSVKTAERISEVAQRKSDSERRYVAGMNGDFFITSSFAANHPLGKQILGYPNVTSATSGKIISPDAIDHDSREKCFILTDDGRMYIDATDLSYSITLPAGKSVQADNVNYPREDGQIVIYNSFYGSTTRTDDSGTEISLEPEDGERWAFNRPIRFRVSGYHQSGDNIIPADGAVVSAAKNIMALDALRPGDTITITINLSLPSYDGIKPANISEIIGGDVRVLNNGKVTMAGDRDALRFINAPAARYQRSLIGFSRDGDKLVFCCVDNGIGGGGVSYYDAGDLMRELGCHNALDLDGGGSTLMYLRAAGIVNHLRDGAERAVGNGIYAVVEAPEDNEIYSIRFADHAPRLQKGETYTPLFYGYNRHCELISMNVEGVTLYAPAALGDIHDGNNLVATGEGIHTLTAAYMGRTATTTVTVTESTEPSDSY